MRKNIFLCAIFIIATAFSTSSMAERESASFELGTLGYGFGYALDVPFYTSKSSSLNARFTVNYLDLINHVGYAGVVDYSEVLASPNIATTKKTTTDGAISLWMALLDWHPNNSNFRVTFGVAYNDTKAEQTLHAINHSVDIKGSTELINYTRESAITFDKSAIYFGIGYGSNLRSKRGLRMNFSLGVLYQGEPIVDMEVSGPGASKYNQVLSDIKKEAERQLVNSSSYDDLKAYPHFALGLEYKM